MVMVYLMKYVQLGMLLSKVDKKIHPEMEKIDRSAKESMKKAVLPIFL